MSIQELSHAIVHAVLHVLDRHTFAAIPANDIVEAYSAVAKLLRQESAALIEPAEETLP